jgi:hypothetical protein
MLRQPLPGSADRLRVAEYLLLTAASVFCIIELDRFQMGDDGTALKLTNPPVWLQGGRIQGMASFPPWLASCAAISRPCASIVLSDFRMASFAVRILGPSHDFTAASYSKARPICCFTNSWCSAASPVHPLQSNCTNSPPSDRPAFFRMEHSQASARSAETRAHLSVGAGLSEE